MLLTPIAAGRGPTRVMSGRSAEYTRGPWRLDPAAVVFALLAASWHAFLTSKATNDNFLHMTLAQQLLAGDWPVRDFFDHGWVLQYVLSAAAQLAFGQRLLSEAIVVGAAWAISTYIVFRLVRGLTGSTTAAALAALLLIGAGARAYSYPKGIVYAVAAMLWWGYVRTPAMGKVALFGGWAGVAFYWRPDHGVFVALGLALAVLVAHGLRWVSIVRCSLGAAAMLAVTAPFLLYVQLTVGLPQFVETGLVQAQVEHATHGSHEWPVLRLSGQLFTIAPATDYAPSISIRWASGSAVDSRRRILMQYGLTPLTPEDEPVSRARLSGRSIADIRALLNEPLVEDTAGIDRSTATLPASDWPAWRRWSFNYAPLRLRVLPSLDAHARASELTAALFYGLAILLFVAARWMPRHLSGGVTAGQLAAFAVYAFVIDAAMLRNPFPARAPDAVVLSAIAFGCCIAAFWRAADSSGIFRRGLVKAGTAVLVLLVTTSAAAAGEFGDRVNWLAGEWTSLRRARGAWGELYGELLSSPPLIYYRDRPAAVSLRLAAYVRACVPADDRLLVLWFAPDIHYHSDRLMAQRHLVFVPAWSALEDEQRMTLEKVRRYSPPVVLARRSSLDAEARATYPGVVEYVEQEYAAAASVHDDGEEYLILARRDRAPLRGFGAEGWPCYVREESVWSRVGRPAE